MEKQLRRFYESDLKFNKKEAEKDFKLNNYNTQKKRIEDLNFAVDQTANQISILIFNAEILNDSILRMMNDPIGIAGLSDSLAVLDKTIRQSELLVDSLNKVFEENSSNLLKMMEEYDKKDQEIKLMTIEADGLRKFIFTSKILLITNLALFVLTLFLGVILLIKGLAMRRIKTPL
ncbi:MAG: hypothetical protein QNK30_16105 [Bacteroidales bacterium]|nr:hypothetical protein [Bacteroidales bacterium]